MTHRSQIDTETFQLIASGQRMIEPRLYDPSHRQIKIGDLILFVDRDNHGEQLAKVVGLLRYPSFKELFAANPLSRFGMQSEADLHQAMHQFYRPDDELRHGVVGIKLHLLSQNKD